MAPRTPQAAFPRQRSAKQQRRCPRHSGEWGKGSKEPVRPWAGPPAQTAVLLKTGPIRNGNPPDSGVGNSACSLVLVAGRIKTVNCELISGLQLLRIIPVIERRTVDQA